MAAIMSRFSSMIFIFLCFAVATNCESNDGPGYTISESMLEEFQPLSNLHSINLTTSIDQQQLATLQNNAELGDTMSNYFLGLTNLYGLGKTNPNAVKASRYFRLAAEAGNMDAACALGLLLYMGTGGVGRDSAASTAWFRMASSR